MPREFRWADPQTQALLSAEGLDRLDALLDPRLGLPVASGHKSRETVLLHLAREGRVVYLKREHATLWKDLARHLAAGRGWWTKARLEFEVLVRLRQAGIRCPRPLMCWQRGWPRPEACLILEQLPHSVELNRFLASRPFASPAERQDFFSRLGREIARLHHTGTNQPDLYSIHVYILDPAGARDVAFIDFQRSDCAKCLSLEGRARDLGALWATLPDRLADDDDRQTLLESYLQEGPIPAWGAELAQRVRARADCLLTRRRIWEIRESDTVEHQRAPKVDDPCPGTMWIDPEFRPILERAGLASFSAVMETQNGQLMRALKERENWRLRLDDGHPAQRGAYLKKHHLRGVGPWMRARLGIGPGETAGRIEARNVACLARGGIAAMRLIAYGEKLHADGLLESFVLTDELVGYAQLDHFLRAAFPPLVRGRSSPRDHRLASLIRSVASTAARFHRLGYNHRDLYCCHFFIREPEPGLFQVNLIDLQRVEHRRRFRTRWIVKDLAQLAYSAPRDRISRTHMMAFIKQYLDVKRLEPRHKRLIRRVLSKVRIMRRNLGDHP
jgi:heptose I phosphotransferase